MKRITLLFAFIIFSFTGMAQRISLSKSATINPPKKLYKVQKSEISSLLANRFNKTKYLAKSVQDNSEKVYQIDDIVVLINSVPIARQHGYLKAIKFATDDTFRGNKNYSSKIEVIGGKDVFIIDQISEGLKLYRFFTANNSEDFVVTGFVQYKLGDEIKARTVLEDLIKGLKFE